MCLSVHVMDRPWEAFDRARRVLRGRDDLVGWKSADLPSVRRDSLPLSKVSVRLAALALLLVHGHWAACALHVRVCAPEECGEALPLIRRAAAGLTCGPP